MEKPTSPQGNHTAPTHPDGNMMYSQTPPQYQAEGPITVNGPPHEAPMMPPQAHGGLPTDGFPPHGGYYPPEQNTMPTLPLQSLQSQSAPVLCPKCNSRGMTVTTAESGGFTHAIAAVVCCATCLGCIPYCISSLKDVHHRCGNCGIPLATFHRSGRTEVLGYNTK